jgi:glycosyltransferase involved in cell wall biosynthesis
MAVHFRVSQADEHAEPGREIKRNGAVFRAIRKLEREVILRVDGLVYVSKWARDSLLSWLPDAASLPSAVIGNAVTPLAVEERLELLADIVTIGRLDLPKNHRFLLDILSEAKCLGRIIKLDIYGDGPLRRDLARQVKKLGLDGQVRILGYCTNVRQVLPAYRAYVHSSYAETSSLAIIEAMAARLPVVAANIGPIPELYDDGVEGRFWPLDDPARAAAILLELLDSEEALSAAAAAAYDRFQREFDIASVGARLEGFLMGKIEE